MCVCGGGGRTVCVHFPEKRTRGRYCPFTLQSLDHMTFGTGKIISGCGPRRYKCSTAYRNAHTLQVFETALKYLLFKWFIQKAVICGTLLTLQQ